MSAPEHLLRVNDQNLKDVVEADLGVLILAKSDCGYCASYEQDILQLIGRGKLQGVTIGKLVLDAPGSGRFKRDNPWLAGLKTLPYTLLYRKGERVDEFSASKGLYLLEKIEDLLAA